MNWTEAAQHRHPQQDQPKNVWAGWRWRASSWSWCTREKRDHRHRGGFMCGFCSSVLSSFWWRSAAAAAARLLGRTFIYTFTWEFIRTQADGLELERISPIPECYLGTYTYLIMSVIAIFSYSSKVGGKLNQPFGGSEQTPTDRFLLIAIDRNAIHQQQEVAA